jgi:hypothetical protein
MADIIPNMDTIAELLTDPTPVTRKEIAAILHVSVGTVNQWARAGLLPDPIDPESRPLKYVTSEVIRREVDLVYSKLRHIGDDGQPYQTRSADAYGIPDGCYGSTAMARIRGTTVNTLHRRVRSGAEHEPSVTPSGAWYWTHDQAQTPKTPRTTRVGAPRWEDVVPYAVAGPVYSRLELMEAAGISSPGTWIRLVTEGTIPKPHYHGRYQYWGSDGLDAANRFRSLAEDTDHA